MLNLKFNTAIIIIIRKKLNQEAPKQKERTTAKYSREHRVYSVQQLIIMQASFVERLFKTLDDELIL